MVSTKAVVKQLFSQGGSGRHVKQRPAPGRSLRTSKAKVTTQLSKSSDSKFLPRLRKQHTPHPLATRAHRPCRPLSLWSIPAPHQAQAPTTPRHYGLPAAPGCPPLTHACPALPSLEPSPASTSEEAAEEARGLSQTHHPAATPLLAYLPLIGLLQLHKGLLFCRQALSKQPWLAWHILCR